MSTQPLTTKDLFRLSFSEPVVWLADEAGANAAVQWIASSVQDIRPGDLLLLPATHLNADILVQAQQRQAVAILLIGSLPDCPDVSSSYLPVALLQEQLDLRSIQQLLLTILVNQRAGLMERGVRIHAQLSQLAAEGEGLAPLIRAMSDISGKGVLVQDKRLQILAEHPSPALQAIWHDVSAHLSDTENLPASLRDRKLAGRRAVIISQDIPGGLARIIIPIIVSEVARGYLSLVGMAGELDELDRLVAEQGALVCAVEMARNKALREAEKRWKGNLVTALLQDNLSPRDALLWTQAMGLDLSKAHVALRFAWDGSTVPSRRRLETLVNGEVARQGLRVIVNAMGNEVICFCQVPALPARPEPALAFARSVIDQGHQEYPQIPIRCGIGSPAGELSDWRTSFRQAGQSLDMARRLGENEPLYFPDLSVYRLLLQIEHNPELIAFQEEILGPLLAYDGGQELIHTLEAYFEHNTNLSQTAEALFIHRNTLIYRMERIASITNLDLDKPETRMAIQLALHIFRMRGTSHG